MVTCRDRVFDLIFEISHAGMTTNKEIKRIQCPTCETVRKTGRNIPIDGIDSYCQTCFSMSRHKETLRHATHSDPFMDNYFTIL